MPKTIIDLWTTVGTPVLIYPLPPPTPTAPRPFQVALDQMSSFTPRLLAPFTRYLALSYAYPPPPELLTAINLKALQQLEQYKGLELGLLLQGLAEMKGLGGELAEAVAAGIAAEEKVKVSGGECCWNLSHIGYCNTNVIHSALLKPETTNIHCQNAQPLH